MLVVSALVAAGGLCAAAWGQSPRPRLLLISVDGLRPDVITPEHAPRMSALSARGTHAGMALNDLPSATLPNHATMLTGLVSDRHGVLLNVPLPGTIGIPTLFDYAARAGLRCAFFAGKAKLTYLAPPEACETIDIDGSSEGLAQRAAAALSADGPDVVFVHLRDPDSAGHAAGWLSGPYFDAVAHADELIGRLIDAADADARRDTFVILTADHGGEGLNHFLNVAANRMVPFVASGPGIEAGGMIDDLVTLADVTPTALRLLGLELPAGLSGRAVPLVEGAAADGSIARESVPLPDVPCMLLVIPALGALALLGRPRRAA